jgi:hypothetical protein
MYIDLDNYRLCLINFRDIFDRAYKDIVSDLILYDKFTDLNVRNQDTKKIYYYHLIRCLCDAVIKSSTTNKIIIYYCAKDLRYDFKKCTNRRSRAVKKADPRGEFVIFMDRFIKQLKSIMPMHIHIGDVKMNTFIQYYNTNKGKYIEVINDIRYNNRKEPSLRRVKEFANKYKLTYLTNHYFNQLKVKCIMYK